MNAIASYRSQRVQSASPVQIVVMLFQELLRQIELGAQAIDDRRTSDVTTHLHRAREVIAELYGGLDPRGESEALCGHLAHLYAWSSGELVAAGRERDSLRARRVARSLEPLLEGWFGVLSGGS